MDDEKLDLIRRLQGVIKKNMGDIEPSDQWLIYHGNNFIGCNVPCLRNALADLYRPTPKQNQAG